MHMYVVRSLVQQELYLQLKLDDVCNPSATLIKLSPKLAHAYAYGVDPVR